MIIEEDCFYCGENIVGKRIIDENPYFENCFWCSEEHREASKELEREEGNID
jgi:hypothetical protein